MSHPDDSKAAWAIWLPWLGITCSGTFACRNAAIRDFVINMDDEPFQEQEASGRVFISTASTALTDAQRRAWSRWKAKGAMAVHVEVNVADYRVREARAAYEAGKGDGNDKT